MLHARRASPIKTLTYRFWTHQPGTERRIHVVWVFSEFIICVAWSCAHFSWRGGKKSVYANNKWIMHLAKKSWMWVTSTRCVWQAGALRESLRRRSLMPLKTTLHPLSSSFCKKKKNPQWRDLSCVHLLCVMFLSPPPPPFVSFSVAFTFPASSFPSPL